MYPEKLLHNHLAFDIFLAGTIKEEFPGARKLTPDFKVISRIILLPMQDYTEAEYQWALDVNAEPLYHESPWLINRRRMKILRLHQLRQSEATPPPVSGNPWHLPVEIQVFRLNRETVIITTPAHSFVELGLDLKERSPFANTMIIEFTHANIGYIPPLRVFQESGYQPIKSRLVPGSS